MTKAEFYKLNRAGLRFHREQTLALLATAKTFKNKDGYIFVTRQQNPHLFSVLDGLQFFEFQYRNQKHTIAGVHQIVLYLHVGMNHWRWNDRKVRESQSNGGYEVHHLDSNPSNNCIDNLYYVTAQQNQLCADAVHKKYAGHVTSATVSHFANFTGAIKDTASLVRLTIIRTLQALGITDIQIPSIAYIFLQLPKNIGKDIILNWRLA